ncbi:MAG: DUF6439 family protein [Oculatellaceae cyanobacterium bins.114]|nr:DUF6439 family protein [Oculatellaceae cyanobacterium bins.114]
MPDATMPDITMPDPTSVRPLMSETTLSNPKTSHLSDLSTTELAQALAERLAIAPTDWHRLKSNRKARASEQAAIALVYLLKNNPEEALLRLQQAEGWLDRSISAPPCPTHGH